MKKQYNVLMDDADVELVESAVPGAKGGTAIRVAALMFARKAAGEVSPAEDPKEVSDEV